MKLLQWSAAFISSGVNQRTARDRKGQGPDDVQNQWKTFPLLFLLAVLSHAGKLSQHLHPLQAHTHAQLGLALWLSGLSRAKRTCAQLARLLQNLLGQSETAQVDPPAACPVTEPGHTLPAPHTSIPQITQLPRLEIAFGIAAHLQYCRLASRPSCVKACSSSMCNTHLKWQTEQFSRPALFFSYCCFLSWCKHQDSTALSGNSSA